MSHLGFDVVDGDGHVVETRPDLERYGWTGRASELIDQLLSWTTSEDWRNGLKASVDAGAFEPSARHAGETVHLSDEPFDPLWALLEELERSPSEYLLEGRCYFSCEPDEPLLAGHVHALGERRVIFASDYPHFDCEFPDSAQALLESGLSRRALRRIAGANARELYSL